METLRLSFTPKPEAQSEARLPDCADGFPQFLPIPTPRLPVRRLVEGLGAECVLLVAGIFLASIVAPTSHHKPPDGPDATTDKKGKVTLIFPMPIQKGASHISTPGAKNDERPRFFLPPKPVQVAVAPILEPPLAVPKVRADLIPPIPEIGLPPQIIPIAATLQVRAGSLKPPAAPVPNLDASPTRTAGLPQHGKDAVGDPLATTGSRTGSVGQGYGVARTPGGPPDLSPEPLYTAARAAPKVKSAFTKPQILFMPKPTYPPAILAERIEGDVIIEVTFDKNGRVIFRRFIRKLQNTELNSIARETAERIKFAPAKRDEVPVDQDSVITVFFRLSQLNMTALF